MTFPVLSNTATVAVPLLRVEKGPKHQRQSVTSFLNVSSQSSVLSIMIDPDCRCWQMWCTSISPIRKTKARRHDGSFRKVSCSVGLILRRVNVKPWGRTWRNRASRIKELSSAMCCPCYPHLLRNPHCDQLDWVFPLLALSVDIRTTWSPQRVSRMSRSACWVMSG